MFATREQLAHAADGLQGLQEKVLTAEASGFISKLGLSSAAGRPCWRLAACANER
jgi:hypothetical protein